MKGLNQKVPAARGSTWRYLLLVTLTLLPATTVRSQNVIGWGDDSTQQIDIPTSATNVVAVAGGARHSLALRADGTIIGWGVSGTGAETPPAAAATNAMAIAAGYSFSIMLTSNGAVHAWGDNTYNQRLVPATVTNNVIAIAAGYYFGMALKNDGTVVVWGEGLHGQTNVPAIATNIVAIAAGAEHCLALRADGSVVVWGGMPTIGTTPPLFYTFNSSVPAAEVVGIGAGSWHNLALTGSGGAVAWGLSGPLPPDATNAVMITGGTNFTLELKADGTVGAWTTTNVATSITNVPASATNIVTVAAGLLHGLAVVGDGTPRLYSAPGYRNWTLNNSLLPLSIRAAGSQPMHYQWLANGASIPDTDTPFPQIHAVLGNDNVNYQVVVANAFGIAISTEAQVSVKLAAGWGDSRDGQIPVPNSLINPCALVAGAFHALALDTNGSVYAWGKNVDGQATVPPAATNVVAVAAGGDHSLALRDGGSVIAWGRDWDGQTNVPSSATNVVAIAAGWAHSLALRADGAVIAWGNDAYSQTDVSMLANNIKSIAAGYYHNIALRSDGVVVTWGWDIPVPPQATNVVAIAAGYEHCLVLRGDGSVVAWGSTNFGLSTVPPMVTNVVAIAAAYYYDTALRADGSLLVWGKGIPGVISIPSGLSNLANVAPGEDYTMVLAALGAPRFAHQLASVTAHAGGQVTLNAGVQGSVPMTFQWYYNGVAISGATNQSLVLTGVQANTGGSYTLAATNSSGGTLSSPIVLNVTDPETLTIVGGWGDSSQGQLAIPRTAANPIAIAAGEFHCLALNPNGSVVAWGKGGLFYSNSFNFFEISPTNVPPTATNIVAIAAGGNHSLALNANSSIIAWGRNWDGQTNVPSSATNVVAIAAGWAHSLALRADGSLVAWGNDDYGQTDIPPQASGAIAIAAGYYHNLALRSDRTVVAWGLQSTVPTSATNVIAISAGWRHNLVLRADGSLVAWGDNSYGQCNIPPAATNVIAVAAGYHHSVALRSDGTVVAWGKDIYAATEVPSNLLNVASIAAGEDYTLAIVQLGPPQFQSPLIPESVHVGGQLILNATASGTYPFTSQWFHDSQAIPGATNANLVLTGVQTNDSGTYTVQVVNGAQQTNTQTSLLTVLQDPAIVGTTSFQNISVGGNVCLSPIVTGAEPLSRQWQLNGVNLADNGHISGSTSDKLCLSSAQPSDSGTYSLVLVNAYGSTTGIVAQVSVTPLLAWGDNSAAQLQAPANATDVSQIAAGWAHSLVLRSDGTVIPWGDNSFGQSSVPPSLANAIAVADGESHSLALRANGTVIAWGDNSFHQTNVPTTVVGALEVTNVIAIAAGGVHSLALQQNGNVLEWGYFSYPGPPINPFPANIVSIAAGQSHSLALQANGVPVQSGSIATIPPAASTNIVAIAAGANHDLALRADGVVVAWGANYYGQATVPHTVTNAIGIAAGGNHSLALLANGTWVAWGDDTFDQSDAPSQPPTLTSVAAGDDFSLALTGSPLPSSLLTKLVTNTLGTSSSFNAPKASVGPDSYQWQLNGINIVGATNATFGIGGAGWTNAGTYQVIISNVLGSVTSAPTIFTVQRTPLRFDNSTLGVQTNSFHLRLLGASGTGPLIVYASSNMLDWSPLFQNPPVIGSVDFSDPWLVSAPPRFYRAAEQTAEGPINVDFATSGQQAQSGAFPLRVTGLSAAGPVTIYASSNFVDWRAIFTNPPTIGPLLFQEPPQGQAARFYRASELR
jgi:alpha-tubulin suppressor-like RCC1 family protein